MLRKVISLLVVVLIMGFFQFVVAGRAMANECPVTGTMDNVVNAALKHLEPNLVDDCTRSAIQPGSAASLEMTTIGEEPQPIPNPGNPEMPYLRPGLIPFMSRQVAGLISTPPISSAEYVADVMHNFGVPGVGQAYAQTGIGFNALKPVLPIWKAFRNIAYALYVIIFIVIGFMIMFRAKINPQTVVTIQSALPNLVITLILITFSYAIAGFLVDLIYVGIYVAAYALQFGGVFEDATKVISRLMTENLYTILFKDQNYVVTAPAEAIKTLVENLISGDILKATVGWTTSAVARLIIGIMLTFSMIKLFVVLGLGFVRIILSTVIAPLQIMLNAFPGSNAFASWFKSILANVAMFPVIAVMFMLAAAFMGPESTDTQLGRGTFENPFGVRQGIGYVGQPTETAWTPPFLIGRTGENTQIMATEDNVSPVVTIIGLMLIFMMPQVAQMTRDTLQVKVAPYTSEIGKTAGPAGAAATWLPRHLWGRRQAAIGRDQQADAIGAAIRRSTRGG